jgi:transcription elongation factor GreA
MNKKSQTILRMRFTQEGYEQLQQEQVDLLAQRPAVVEDLRKARDMGDLKENGYYQASRSKLNSIDGRLTKIAYHLKTGKIIDASASDVVGIGSTVTLKNSEREIVLTFVGDFEADPSQKKLSLLSPFGRAVEGKKVGDMAEIMTPKGPVRYEIIAIV